MLLLRFSLVFLLAALVSAQEMECSCDDCPYSATALLGTTENIISPECPEGSVATLTELRSMDTTGDYEVITWNLGATTLTDTITSPYKYANATKEDEDVECFSLTDEQLPVIGDQTEMKVTLNCEWTRCSFVWDIEWACSKTGVLLSDSGGGLQVLSDVDDTIVCPNPQGVTDPHRFAGADTRLEAKELYPGVSELLLGLALGPGDATTKNTTTTTEEATNEATLLDGAYVPAKPMLLSARPREALVLGIGQDSEINQYMEEVGSRNNKPSWGVNIDSSMYGTLLDGVSHNEFGETKAKHYSDVSQALPNTRFAFMGDNGQGDVCGAQSMLQSSTGNQLMAIFIHKTQPDESKQVTICEDPIAGSFTLDLPESEKVHYHSNHADAAKWALDQGLISCCSANSVQYAIQEWIICRCDGNCNQELLTGVTEQATRNETLVYCDELKADADLLQQALDQCDTSSCPSVQYPDLAEEPTNSPTTASATNAATKAPSNSPTESPTRPTSSSATSVSMAAAMAMLGVMALF